MTNSSRRVARHSHRMALAVAAMLVAGLLPAVAAPALAVPGPYLILVGVVPTAVPAGNGFTLTVGTSSDGTTVRGDLTANVTITSSDPSATASPTSPRLIAGSQAFAMTLPTKPASGTEVTQTVTFSASGYVSAVATIKVTKATKLAFVTQPGSGSPNNLLGRQPVVAVQDAYGNTVADATNGITLSLLPPSTSGLSTGGILRYCYAAGRAAGVTTFDGCTVTAVGREYRLDASATDLASATSAPFDVSARLAFTANLPTGVTVGAGVMNPAVSVNWTTSGTMNGGTRSLSDNTTIVTLAIKPTTGTAGATLTCDTGLSVTVVAGLAQFTNCRIDKAGSAYKLLATSSPVMTGAESTAVDITAGVPTKLTFLQEPSAGTAGTAFLKQPIVAITDAGGNVSRTSSATIVLSIASSTSTGVLTCTNTAPVTSNGQANFSGCSISKPGTYTLLATPIGATCGGVSCSIAAATSKSFTLTVQGATVSLTASASSVTVGQRVTLTTTLTPNGGSRSFQLQRSRDGANWTTWLTPMTGATGTYSFTYTPSYNFYYRSVYAGAADLTAGISPVVRVYVRQTAKLTPHAAATQLVGLGRSKTYATTVRPKTNPVGRAVVRYFVYKRYSTGWELVRTRDVLVNSSGIARLTNRFTSRGSYRVRSVALATTHNTKSLYTTWEYVRVP